MDLNTSLNTKIRNEIKTKNANKIGLIAQEVQEIIPEAVIYEEANNAYYIDYVAIIPVLIEAIKEQQEQIEDLTDVKKDLIELQLKFDQLTSKNKSIDQETIDLSNTPNPFTFSTKIKFKIPFNFDNGEIKIVSRQGHAVETLKLSSGMSSITFDGSSLMKGIYYYYLILDGEFVKSNSMIKN